MKKRKILQISLSVNGKIFAVCSDLEMEPYSLSTARKFTFKKLSVINEVRLSYRDKVNVQISNRRRDNLDDNVLHDFEILLLDCEELQKADWWIYGLVYNAYEDEYRQSIIDVFRVWQNDKVYEWNKLPIGSPLKEDYFMACFYYSSIQSKMIGKDILCVDVSQVKEEQDFYYFLSIEFFGARSYIGRNFYTFDDCLLELYNHDKNQLTSKQIVFYNAHKLFSDNVDRAFKEIKHILSKYGLVVKED